jgi:phenylalanyl-tRNA synthetase beta chain
MTAIVRGVKVGPSPDWIASRIEAAGARSISNIVDVTNYMLHGFGQPMHAFDLRKIDGEKIIVRRARAGEKLKTLDGVDRVLDDSMMVIADAHHATAIAGVIGGKGSEVTDETTDILLEVAAFNPQRVRATRRKLGISTDASYRFERGVDQAAIPDLLNYAVELITRVAGGVVHGDPTDTHEPYTPPGAIRLRISRVERLLGEKIGADEIEKYLTSIGFIVNRDLDSDQLLVTPPSFRADVVAEAEVIEEIARLHGYENFSSEIRAFRPGTVPDAPMHILSRRVRERLISLGLLESRPMPFVRAGEESHRVRNPLAEDEAYLRTSVIDTLGRRAEYNFAHMQRNVRLFEIGTVFTAARNPDTGAPAERIHAAAVIAGDRRPRHFTEPQPPHFDEWDAKALAEAIVDAAWPGAAVSLDASVGEVLWNVSVNGNAVGTVTRVSVDAPVWASPVYGVEIDLDAIPFVTATRGYRAIPNMPAMEVDLALIVPNAITSDQVASSIRGSAGDLLESLEVFDEFKGKGIPEDTRSLAWRLTFRHPERTLRDREIQGRTAKILSTLEAALGVKQRSS